ncbi:MAG: LytTR family DNA-binding domain-containing protein [Bacteroidota bacterium]
MKSYKAIIVEGEKSMREALERSLNENCPEIEVCGTAATTKDGREILENNHIDFIFLDICFRGEDSFTFLQTIPKNYYGIIFTSASEEYALKALKVNAIDFLLKPVNAAELREAVTKAVNQWEWRQQGMGFLKHEHDLQEHNLDSNMVDGRPCGRITVAHQFGFRVVPVSNIIYLQADSNYTILCLANKSRVVSTRPLGEFDRILNHPVFFRIHKSTIINMNFLEGYSSFEGSFAEMSDGTRFCISRRKLSEFREAVDQYSKSAR